MKAVSGISVNKSLEIDERWTISPIMDEVKNMLDYKVRHYVRQVDLTYDQKQNILRSFIFMKQKYYPTAVRTSLRYILVKNYYYYYIDFYIG